MQKNLEIIHKYSSIIPFLYMVCVLAYILIARIELGYFPTYGSQPDPAAFGYFILEVLGFVLFLLSIPASIMWIIGSSIGIVIFKKEFRLNCWSVLMYLCGIGSFFIMKYCFTSIFEWYMD